MDASFHNTLGELLAGGAVWWTFAALVDALPPPRPKERWYGFAYRAAHIVAANFSRVRKGK